MNAYAHTNVGASSLGGLFAATETTASDLLATLDALPDNDPFEDDVEEEPVAEEKPKTGAVHLRPHQEKTVKAVINEYNKGAKSTLAVLATGTGKSVILAEMSRRFSEDWGHGVLNLCHRDELIRQMAKACGRLGVHALIEKADERAINGFGFLSKCVVGSVQSMQGKRLEEWPRDAFKLIITDEAHHACADGYKRVYDHFHKAKLFGLTATADRMDGKNLGSVFETLAFEYNISSAIADGWLVPPRAVQLKTDPAIDLRDLRVTGSGDFKSADLDAKIAQNVSVLVNAVADVNALGNRRTIAFAPDIASAKALACGLEDVGITARAVSGVDRERAAKIKAHQNGEFQVLVNSMLLTEGYDDPKVSCVLICRPTRSRGLYSQMVGRATRLHPESGKTDCLVVDFAFVTAEHDLVSPVDLFDNSDEHEEVVQIARDLVKAGRTDDIQLALGEAREQFESERRVRIQRRSVAVKAGKFDLLTACDLFGVSPQKEAYSWTDYAPASDKQVEMLKKWGIEATTEMGKGTASKLIGKMLARKDHGWANPYQVRDLMQSGFDPETAMGMRESEAKSYLEQNPIPATDKQVNLLTYKFNWNRQDAMALTKKEAIAAINAASGSQ